MNDQVRTQKPGRPTSPNPADHWIQLRVTRARKAAYVRAARPHKLTAWCLQNLDTAADYQAPDTPPKPKTTG